tara:strand:- start:105 stop:278 length:174 start_codon:yes stop_codon:yes gene_type:complete
MAIALQKWKQKLLIFAVSRRATGSTSASSGRAETALEIAMATKATKARMAKSIVRAM